MDFPDFDSNDTEIEWLRKRLEAIALVAEDIYYWMNYDHGDVGDRNSYVPGYDWPSGADCAEQLDGLLGQVQSSLGLNFDRSEHWDALHDDLMAQVEHGRLTNLQLDPGPGRWALVEIGSGEATVTVHNEDSFENVWPAYVDDSGARRPDDWFVVDLATGQRHRATVTTVTVTPEPYDELAVTGWQEETA